MVRCSVYIATSVDGFIARPDGGIDWLHRPEYAASDKVLGFEDFFSTVDTLVMGRNTFEKVLSFGKWPYEGTLVVVLTSREISIPAHLRDKVRIMSGDPERIVSQLALEGKQHLYIDGGITIQRFLKSQMIQEIIITRIPILLGEGIPLFAPIGIEQPLRLLDAISSNNGFLQIRYEVQSAT